MWEAVAKSVQRSVPGAKLPPADSPPHRSASNTSAPAKKPAASSSRAALKNSTAQARPIQRPQGSPEPPIRVEPARSAIDPLGPRTPGLDRRTSKRLSRGEAQPEARLDLHGMSAERAHRALIGFIGAQHAAGARCVLVITGKGGRRSDDLNGWRPDRVGVLKTMAPEWLRQPPLGGMVTKVFQAHQRHGGEGALYVYLRKSR